MNIDRRELAKKITLLESTKVKDTESILQLIQEAAKSPFSSKIVGVFGSPGVGKSSFISSFAELMAIEQLKIAILTIDPSSPLTGGSLLGDKTRMQNLLSYPNIYIRPSPSGLGIGGIASSTAETCLLLQSYEFDYIIIETVGSGQSDIEVSKLADINILIIQPTEGDSIQGLKKGALEVADFILVSKTDGALKELAESTAQEYRGSLELGAIHEKGTQVLNVSSIEGTGLKNLWEKIRQVKARSNRKKNSYLLKKILFKKIHSSIEKVPEIAAILKNLDSEASNDLGQTLSEILKINIELKIKK